MTKSAHTHQRLFFALWPSAEFAKQLHQHTDALTRKCDGRRLNLEQIHLTLRFIGSVDAKTRECLETGVTRLTRPGFELCFDELGYWPKPKVVWASASMPPESLMALAQALENLCQDCGLAADTRGFKPHVTLIRKARHRPAQFKLTPIKWSVSEFVLVASETRPEGAVYTLLRKWPLT